MKIVDILHRDSVIAELKATGKHDIIRELVDVLPRQKLDRDRVVQVLMDREKLGSTGIGDGVAIPHGKLAELDSILGAFGRSTKGVEFESLDGNPTHLFFLLVAPENSAGAHLKALARISRLFKDGQFRRTLMDAHDREELYRALVEEDEKYG
ncbi:MAG: PTS sugar transporter subunit IIA [Thermodesulfobacteriota bacterium]